ncbi:hypothetical protein GGR50DRAFT_702360 [Xylaria sp. CBS 124048]|nr:hypothetical protein GGR50DRAFT_702360 [Xylaria sp. CBS 124048]
MMWISKHDESPAWRDIFVNAALNSVTVIVVGLRLYSRKLTHAGFGWDDGCIVVATMLVNCLLLVAGFLISLGFGLPIEEVDRADARKAAEFGRAFRFLFILCICFVKLSALLFYIRVFGTRTIQPNTNTITSHLSQSFTGNIDSNAHLNPTPGPEPVKTRLSRTYSALNALLAKARPTTFRQTCICLITVVLLWSTANLLQELTVCGLNKPMCINQRYTDLGMCVFNAVGDLVILLVPLWPIWRLQMKTSSKVSLSLVFMLGIVTIFVAFLRFEAIAVTAYGGDYNDTAMQSANYAILEPNLAILCISLPMLQPLLRRLRPWLAARSSAFRSRAPPAR